MGFPDAELPLTDSSPCVLIDTERADASPGLSGSVASSTRRKIPLLQLAGFVATIVVVGLLCSLLVKPWIHHLSWWKVFRRCVSISSLIALWVFMRYLHRQPIRSLGLGAWRAGKRPLLQGVITGFGGALLLAGIYLASGACHIVVSLDDAKLWGTVIGFLPGAVLVATLEELIFRGYVLRQLLAYSAPLAIATSSAAYALVHMPTVFEWPGTGLELVGLAILGGVLALSALRTGQLYAAIGLHAALSYCARVNKLLLGFPYPNLQWLVGTNRLVNGVIAWFILLIIGLFIARKIRVLSSRE